jgi:hypothetical protein
MNILEALRLCKDGGHRVRPILWRSLNPDHWIEARKHGAVVFFVECGAWEEIPHALRLSRPEEFLDEWETFSSRRRERE